MAENRQQQKSLLLLLQALAGHRVTVELLDDTAIEGEIEGVDAAMNIHLRNAEAVTARGEEISWPELLVRGRLLRYIDVPPEIDVRAAIADKQAAMLAGRMAYARKPKKAKT